MEFACRLHQSRTDLVVTSPSRTGHVPADLLLFHCHAETHMLVQDGDRGRTAHSQHTCKLSSCPSCLPVLPAPASHAKSPCMTDLSKSHTAFTQAGCRVKPPLLWAFWACLPLRQAAPPPCLEPSGDPLSRQHSVQLLHTRLLWVPNVN